MSLYAATPEAATRPATLANAFRLDRVPAVSDATIEVEPNFDFLSPAYGQLFAGSAATAFQSPLWMDRLHRQLAPAVGAQALTIVVRERQTGELLAVLPFMLQRKMGITIVQPADFGVCDYNSVVASTDAFERLAADPDVRARLRALLVPGSLLIFRKIRADGLDIRRLFPEGQQTLNENAAFHSEIGDDFEEWRRRTLKKKFSKELNRLARQIERDIGPYEHRAATSEVEIREAFAFARTVRTGKFDDDLFLRDAYYDFYLGFAIEGAASGEAVTYVSRIAGKPVAMLFGPAGDGVFHAVVTASDTSELNKFSPGLQILYQMIRQRFDEGHRLFDMGLGNTGYKSQFRVEETPIYNLTLARSLAGHTVSQVYHRAKPVKNLLRRFVPQVR
ncbi:GNAT family N-acetyltransferase [Aureimonas pseudogalii]|uniref:CelD/BcsL family acetyltransferase involved in cellulose biosynthesis n=1 Tax=Aureimonas pseudogalii TaxID=1744844 RepID=A0A7W6H578_9HYPH|nr:GNAT family N-acetyltransferase [Aureimonas pseudogalii]MBB3998783.1 CelD/BcsL family acetyltransferase involved in cellulose biosynthesis [Aureimonas pseudogalii]